MEGRVVLILSTLHSEGVALKVDTHMRSSINRVVITIEGTS